MKNSDKFWSAVIVLLLIYGNIFSNAVRKTELIVLILVMIIYCVINIFYILWRLGSDEETIIPEEFFILYWIITLPVKKFNNFLNNL